MKKLLETIALRGILGLSCIFLMVPHYHQNPYDIRKRTYEKYKTNFKVYLNIKKNHNGIRKIVLPSNKKGYDFDNDGIKDKYIICKDGSYIIHNSSSDLWENIGLGI